jgi:hypothetical protein
MNETALAQSAAWQMSLPLRSFPSDQLRKLFYIVGEKGCTWEELIQEQRARGETDSAFLASAKAAAQAIVAAQLKASDTDALLPEDPLMCLLVVEILKAERDDFLLSATKEQMDQMERTCKKYGMKWETYISMLHKLALDPSMNPLLRRQSSDS